jgi:hypothetical protein
MQGTQKREGKDQLKEACHENLARFWEITRSEEAPMVS